MRAIQGWQDALMNKFINLFVLIFSLNVHALSVNNLSFEATQTCPAYLSKNARSNPDNLSIEPNKSYSIREINKPSPEWFRIEIDDKHTLRWVSARCGFVQQQNAVDDGCGMTGMADSYVLALSSQPGFCETYGFEAGKPECRSLSKHSYQATHLTLHGLWPNKDACGQHYGFCGVRPKSNHCDYDPVPLSPEVSATLNKLMPSFSYGSCLERHEWNKHGSCQILSANDYFSLAVRLVTETDNSSFGNYLREHQGQVVKRSALRNIINKSFGTNNSGKIYLGCTNGILVDVFIQLPVVLSFNEPLTSLIDKAPDHHYNEGCPATVTISRFHKGLWF